MARNACVKATWRSLPDSDVEWALGPNDIHFLYTREIDDAGMWSVLLE
jgi:hypothetical protein